MFVSTCSGNDTVPTSVPVWTVNDVTFDYAESNTHTTVVTVDLPADVVFHNASLYAHVVATRAGFSADPGSDTYDPRYSVHRIFGASQPTTRSWALLVLSPTCCTVRPQSW